MIDLAVLSKWLSDISLHLQIQTKTWVAQLHKKYIPIQNTLLNHFVLKHQRQIRLQRSVIGSFVKRTQVERYRERFGYCRRESGVLLASCAVWANKVVEIRAGF